MINLSVLPLFFTAIFFLSVSPGPDLILISSYSSTKGIISGIMISVGIFISGLIQTIMVAFGLGTLMQALPLFAYIIKILGALYLTWIGIKMLRKWYDNRKNATLIYDIKSTNNSSLVTKGLLNNLINPKALIFFSMFLPQFTNQEGEITLQIMELGLLLSCFALLTNIIFSFLFSKVGSLVGSNFKMRRHIDGLIGLAAKLSQE